MAHYSVHKPFHLGEEKHQMLNLNQRLESYLSRVKLLEEENILLTKEIQALRGSTHNEVTQRKGLEKKLQQARLEVDSAWRERAHMELEVGRLMEELQDLDLQRQREAQAQMKANKMLEHSRKEMEQEKRAQIWLREKVTQLEHEMTHLIQIHQEDVAHLEATMNQSRATMPLTLSHRANQGANVLQLGQEYSQQATRAWQEAAQAYQGQLVHLEESVNQARNRLMQVSQEKSESQLKLQVLEKEIATAQDIKMHLEKTVAQQGQNYSQQLQELQEHLLGLEAERAELGRQIHQQQLQNRDMLNVKMSLSLEVTAYRALLDSESFRGGVTLLNLPGNISVPDAASSPRGVKKHYQSRLLAGHKSTSFSSVHGNTRTASPGWGRKPASFTETPKIPMKPPELTTGKTPQTLPAVKPDGDKEKVTLTELLSPHHGAEAFAKEGSENVKKASEEMIEQVFASQVDSELSSEAHLTREESQCDLATPKLTPYHVRMKEESCEFSDELVPFDKPASQEDVQEPQVPRDEWVEKEGEEGEGEEQLQEESSDSETEAVIEPNFESRTSSPVSECEPEESVFSTGIDATQSVELMQEGCLLTETYETDRDEKLYPDGEEMDTYDRAMERKVDVKMSNDTKTEEEKWQHAEPEEDISSKDQRPEETERRQDLASEEQQFNASISPLTDSQVGDGAPALPPQENEEEDEEEDSQNMLVSWRTESESYTQDNTLADPRPLIQYKSDEADGATQASHMDKSESGEEEQEKMIDEMMKWSEDNAERFGTMEDLREDTEGELDEEYDLGYTHTHTQDLVLDGADELTSGVNERPSDEEPKHDTQELVSPTGSAEVDDEELETGRFVGQEFEHVKSDFAGTSFVQQQVREIENLVHLHDSNLTEESEAEEEEDLPSPNPDLGVIPDPPAFSAFTDQPSYSFGFSEPSMTDAEVQPKDQGPSEEKEKEEKHVSLVTHADETETLLITRPDEAEEISCSEETNPAIHPRADEANLWEVGVSSDQSTWTPAESQQHQHEKVGDSQDVPQAPEWEMLRNVGEQCESAESPTEDITSDQQKQQHLNICPDNVEDDIFVVRSSAELVKKSGNDSSLHDFFRGVKNDSWVSSLETGATNHPDDACNEAAEQTGQGLGFADALVWGDLEDTNVVKWSSGVDTDSPKGLLAEKKQGNSEVKQLLVHSEESEVEAESWSSGEEPI